MLPCTEKKGINPDLKKAKHSLLTINHTQKHRCVYVFIKVIGSSSVHCTSTMSLLCHIPFHNILRMMAPHVNLMKWHMNHKNTNAFPSGTKLSQQGYRHLVTIFIDIPDSTISLPITHKVHERTSLEVFHSPWGWKKSPVSHNFEVAAKVCSKIR